MDLAKSAGFRAAAASWPRFYAAGSVSSAGADLAAVAAEPPTVRRRYAPREMKQLVDQDHKTLVLWAADCAEHVISCFEQTRPNDDRPRKALDAGRAWVRGLIPMTVARAAAFASHAAARDSDSPTARAAARAAGHAAATAHVASHARHAAN